MRGGLRRRAISLVVTSCLLIGSMAVLPGNPAVARDVSKAKVPIPAVASATVKNQPEKLSPGPEAIPAPDAASPQPDLLKPSKDMKIPPMPDGPGGKRPTVKLPVNVPKGFIEGKSTENVKQREIDAKVFDNLDGTQTIKAYAEPVHFKAADGSFKEIDSKVVPADGGFKNVAGPIAVKLAGNAASDQLVSVSAGEIGASFALEGAASSEPQAEGRKLTYRSVRPNVDLEYEVLTKAVKETLILNAVPSPEQTTFRFPLKTNGLEPRTQDGGVGLYDSKNELQFMIQAPVMWDSNRNPESDEPVYGPAKLTLVQEPAGWVLVLEADHGWVSDPTRKLPIYLDPVTHYVGDDRDGGGYDSFVSDRYPTTNNNVFCCSGSPARYENKIGYYDGTTGTNWTYMRFNTEFLNGRTVTDASWWGYFIHSYYPTSLTRFRVQRVGGGWNAPGITWNNKPGLSPEWVDGLAVKNQWAGVNITPWVQNWVNGGWANDGLAIHTDGEGTGSWKKLASNENNDGTPAYLQVTVTAAPTVSFAYPPNGFTTHSLTPSLYVNGSDPDNGPAALQYYFYVWNAASEYVYTSANWSTQSYATISPGALAHNNVYYWMAYAWDGEHVVWPAEGGGYRTFTTTNSGPSIPVPATPAADAVVSTTTPTLTINPSTDPENDVPLMYYWRVATGSDGHSGALLDQYQSGTSWAVPTGGLKNGVTYYWTVIAFDKFGALSGWSAPRSFHIDLKLGAEHTQPFDSAAGMNVNLVNGNLATAYSSPVMGSVGGPVGVTLSYNSQNPGSAGLKGTYYNDSNGNKLFDATEKPVMSRLDPSVEFVWPESPAPGVNADKFLVRWTGFVTVPTTGTYTFGSSSDDGVRIWVNNTLVQNRWIDQSLSPMGEFGTPIGLTAGVQVPIKIEYYENTGMAAFILRVKDPANVAAVVPPSWVSSDPTALPDGWMLSPGAQGSVAYSYAQMPTPNALLIDPAGTADRFNATAGGWAPPPGRDGFLATDGTGKLTLQAEDGGTYAFNADGGLASASIPTDDAAPAAAEFSWTGTPQRLTKITDPVSGRAMNLFYAPDAQCPTTIPAGLTAAPSGRLCRISYTEFGRGVSDLFYSGGHLARIVDPGGAVTDFGYNADGRLSTIRDVLTNDLIASSAIGDPAADTHQTQISYDQGKVQGITLPEPAAGAARPNRTYSYGASTTEVDVAGVAMPNGYARQVTFDPTGRHTQDKDAAGNATGFVWDSQDRLVKVTDPTGLVSTTIFDHASRPTDTYGPGAAGEFAVNNTSATAPRSRIRYDEGMQGLAATFWSNQSMEGRPKAHSLGLGDPSGAVNQDWGLGSPAGIPADNWSSRLTGEIQMGTGTHGFKLTSDNGARLWIDDVLVINNWSTGVMTGTGTYVSGFTGRHRIQIDHFDAVGAAKLALSWAPPGSGETLVPGSALFPRYGLVTGTTDPDGKVGAIEYQNPALGLATAEVADPAGLNLRTITTYETAGAGKYFRRLSRALPKGSASETTYTYWGNETMNFPCGGGSANQGGMLKQRTSPDPAGAQGPVTYQYRYDNAGRMVGSRVEGDANWRCTDYDSRGRVSSQSATDGKTITFDYSNPAQVTTTYIDSGGATRTTVQKIDWTGQPVSYTDEQGVVTRTEFDQASRATQTFRNYGLGETPLVNYGYDAAGRVETVTDSLSGSGRTTTFGYDGASRLKTISRPNGVVTTNTYHAQRGWLTDVRHAKGADLSFSTYTRSPAGRVATETAPSFSRTYNYDGAARLTSTVDGATTRTYTFDANSNRCSTGPTCDGSYAYDDADRITASPFDSGYEYDSHGNLIGIASKGATFEYDGWDHATKIKPDTATSATTETLAPSGRVIRRLVPGLLELPAEDTVYGFAGEGDSPAYSRQALLGIPVPLLPVTSYISGPGGLLTIDTAGAGIWPLANGHGDIVGTTDGAGAFTANPVTDEFGVGDVPASRLGYLGGAQRFATGGDLKLVRMGVRLYDPALGRFLQVDPIEGGSANAYEYCFAEPVGCADTSGLKAYSYSFEIGHMGDPASLAAYTIANCGSVFTISGCPNGFEEGSRFTLFKSFGPFTQGFPVEVTNVTTTSFTFRSLKGHPEGEGRTITFKFYRSGGTNRLRISTSANGSALVNWVILREANFAVAWLTWRPLSSNIGLNYQYSMIGGAVA